jgi:membrane associated rhomboid family serine protease
MGPQRMFGMTPWVRRLMVANLFVFLLQSTLFTSPAFVQQFGFNPLFALARPWTFVTYQFLHGGVLHLAFNMLALYVFGPPVEERMGGRAFLSYYLLCGFGGAILSFGLLQLPRPMGTVIGASGAIYGVALAFAWYWPNEPIYVFPLPEPIAAKWLVAFAVIISLVLAFLSQADGVAHLAHLGGFAAGLVYLKTQDWRVTRAERRLRAAAPPGVLVHPAARVARGSDAHPRPSRPADRDRAQHEIDRVLDKISASGLQSLTPAERKFLTEISKRMRRPQ